MLSQTPASDFSPDVSPDDLLAKHGKSFHWARYLLNKSHADRATRLYAFCRFIDDIADETTSPQDAQQSLLSIKQQITSNASPNMNVRHMLDLMAGCKIEAVIVLELIDGVLSDLTHRPFADQATLLRYCYRVAGTVGLMMCKILDVDNHVANYHAIDLGIGMQLTNICRDVSADAAQGRRYIPASLVGGAAPDKLIDPSPDLRPMAAQAVHKLLDLADRYYASGANGLPYLPIRARMSIHVAGRVYHAIGQQLAQRDYAFWRGRVRVGAAQKSAITLWAFLDVLRPGFWRARHGHDRSLHNHLTELPFTHTSVDDD